MVLSNKLNELNEPNEQLQGLNHRVSIIGISDSSAMSYQF